MQITAEVRRSSLPVRQARLADGKRALFCLKGECAKKLLRTCFWGRADRKCCAMISNTEKTKGDT